MAFDFPFGVYAIQEQTKLEAVARGSDGKLVRWAWDKSNPKNDQWAIVPASYENDTAYYNIISLADPNGYMAVGSDGRICTWPRSDDHTQLFSFQEVEPGLYNIAIKDDNSNVVSVGSNGWILRWVRNGEKSQKFKFVKLWPESVPPKSNEPKGDLRATLPTTEENNDLPSSTIEKKVFIGDSVLPSLLCPILRNQASTYDTLFANSPYIRVKQYRYWYKQKDDTRDNNEEVTHKYTLHISKDIMSRQEITKQLGINAMLDTSVNYEGITAGFSAAINFDLEIQDMLETKLEEAYTREVYVIFPTYKCRIVIWNMVDYFELIKIRSDGTEEVFDSIAISNPNIIAQQEWPPNPKPQEKID